jgi:hypothetical protein
MPASHDYLCVKCRQWVEVSYALSELGNGVPPQVECSCGGTARHTWRSAPGLAGVWEPGTRGIKRTFSPGEYDVQAGRVFHSLKERETYLNSRGLIPMGPDEYKRTISTTNEPQPDFSTLPETMKDAWDEVQAGVPAPPMLKMEDTQVTPPDVTILED